MERRQFLKAGAACALAVPVAALAGGAAAPFARVILDNDFAGDPDGLFQLAHHLLCRSVAIPLIIGSHLPDAFASGHDAADGAARVRELLGIMGLRRTDGILAGAESAIRARNAWQPSPATAAIVREAMRTDTTAPLVYAAGAGLTELALAWLSEPRIGKRIKLVWIGGRSHAAHRPAPGGFSEFNLMIDRIAAQVIFNESDIEIWQVPVDSYEQMLFSTGELDELATIGPLGTWLKAKIDLVPEMFAKLPGGRTLPVTDAYVLGDSPLVTLTALVPPTHPEPTSCSYDARPTPRLLDDGSYADRQDSRPMRVYTRIDAGLTFRDMLARFRGLAAGRGLS